MRRDKEREKETEKRIARLYWEYRGRIWYQANKRLQNEQDAEDIVQEVFMYLIQNKGELNQVPESRISSIRSWTASAKPIPSPGRKIP